MQIAHIVPRNYSHLLSVRTMVMCLAQFVLSDEDYADEYADFEGHAHVIMDNGLAEEGRPLGPDKLAQAIELVHPSEVVLPDFIEPAANIGAAEKTLQHEGFMKAVDQFGVKLMYVPHGDTLDAWVENLRAAERLPVMPDSIGISKFHDRIHPNNAVYGRGLMGLITRGFFPNAAIHYLGLSLPINEMVYMAFGRSCDTCIATMMAYNNIKLAAPTSLYRPDVVGYKHDAVLTDQQIRLAWHNMDELDEAARHQSFGRFLNG